jgi:hypothetical protein
VRQGVRRRHGSFAPTELRALENATGVTHCLLDVAA